MALALVAFLLVTFVGNVVAVVLVRRDKKAAQAGTRRRPERSFYLLAMLGWWPGLVLAMRRHRHKTRKASFRMRLAASAVVGTALWVGLAVGAWALDGMF